MFAILLLPSVVQAVDWSFTGFLRQEIAVSITNDKNPNNSSTNRFTEGLIPVDTHSMYNPGATRTSAFGDPTKNNRPGGAAGDATKAAEERGIFAGSTPVVCTGYAGTSFLNEDPGAAANLARGLAAINAGDPTLAGCGQFGNNAGIAEDSTINLFNTRLEFDTQANNITDRINGFMKLRLYFNGTSNFNDEIVGDHFQENFYGNRGGLLEMNSNDFMIDIPALYFDYNKGPLWIRVGQQQIAWGEALFFRVFDVANGLDLRRHFFLDVGGEEYADERISSPGVRVSYTFKSGVEIDAFVQMFAPTLLPGMNTAYNLVTSAFSWDNRIELDDAKNSLQYGMRVIWPVTDAFTMQVMSVNRRNPDGVVRWHDAPATLDNGAPNPFCSGRAAATIGPALNGGLDFSGLTGSPFGRTLTLSAKEIATLNTTTGGLTRTKYTEHGCGSFFAPDAMGGSSGQNWYDLAPQGRLNSAAAAEASINLTQVSSLEARKVFGLPGETGQAGVGFGYVAGVNDAITRFGSQKGATHNTLDAFYTGFGNLRGYITREFKRETIVGFGGNYIFDTDDPEDFINQLMLRGEMSFTKNKQFTALDLSGSACSANGVCSSTGFIEEDEWVASIITEKYHRWTDAVPAMYMVAEWMFKSQSDMFGRHLSGSENTPGLAMNPDGTYVDDGIPDGSDSFNAVVFAFQQPFPDLIWRLDAAFLLDLEGGWFFQPGIRFRPSARFQFDFYANIAQDGGNKNDDVMETIDWADEVFVRATYFF